MARKPNYDFERRERERQKSIKVAEKAEAKRAARERARLEEGGEPQPGGAEPAAGADPATDKAS